MDNGATWYRITGDKGEPGDEGDKGDAFFAKAPEDHGTHNIFTLSDDDNTDLSDNLTIEVPAYRSLQIGDGTGMFTLTATTQAITLTYPTDTDATDYRALVAQITPEGADGTYTDISTRADNAADWSVEGDLQGETVTVTVEAVPQVAKALLRVTLIRNDGSEVTASCILGLSYIIENGDTYTVYTPQGLLAWASKSDDYNCTLAADIDMSGQAWPEITRYEHTFDGAGHTISNLNVNDRYPAGFIGTLERGGTVKNLLLVNANISGDTSAGGIVGSMPGGTVIACAVSGCTVKGMSCAGGIAGEVITEPNSVIACYATSCDIEGPERASGHIAGRGTPNLFSVCFYDGTGSGLQGIQDEFGAFEQVYQTTGWKPCVEWTNNSALTTTSGK